MITYEMMLAAIEGDPLAAEQVLLAFDSYIDRLSTHAFLDGQGRVTYGVDTARKTQLQGKLLAAMLHFKI